MGLAEIIDTVLFRMSSPFRQCVKWRATSNSFQFSRMTRRLEQKHGRQGKPLFRMCKWIRGLCRWVGVCVNVSTMAALSGPGHPFVRGVHIHKSAF